jgi:hypothetical protein
VSARGGRERGVCKSAQVVKRYGYKPPPNDTQEMEFVVAADVNSTSGRCT